MADHFINGDFAVKLKHVPGEQNRQKSNNMSSLVPSSLYISNDKSASDVARAMIEIGDQKEPFYTFDLDVAYNHVQKFREQMPRVQIFYAMKSNDYSMMVRLAIALGLGFDCASPGEINKIRKFNVPPTSIIYAAPMKTPEQMTFALQSGVRHTTFDSLCELRRLRQYWSDARLLIRIQLESDSVYKLGDKFGCEFMEALTLLKEAAQLGMTVIGVAFHVGSYCFSKESYTAGLQMARSLFDHEAREGRRMCILDIGGGFYNDGTDAFEQVAALVNKGLGQWFPEPDVQVIAEPGRYVCEMAFTLYSNIRSVRQITDSNRIVNMIYLNSGRNGTLQFIESWHKIEIIKTTNTEELTEPRKTLIWGPTLDDRDFIGPVNLALCSVKDWLAFYHQGAYCMVFESKFCGMDKAPTRSIISEKLWLKLRHKAVFASDFVLDSDILYANLPSNIPPLLPHDGIYVHSLNSTLL